MTSEPTQSTSLQPDVAAVLSAPGAGELADLLDSLTGAELVPGHLVIVTRQDADELGTVLAARSLGTAAESVRIVRLSDELSPQRALAAALPELPGSVRYAWLLTNDCRPDGAALAALLTAARTSRAAAVIAPKVRTRSIPPALVSVGYPLTEAGRWVQQPRIGEVDQGQYDDRSDVLATSGVGALFDVTSLTAVDGYAPRLRRTQDAVAADVDLCWRLHREGGRVLLVPQAVVELEPDAADPLSHPAELASSTRRTVRAIALGALPLPAWLIRVPAVIGTALVTAILMLLAKQPRAAARELADGLAVLRLDRAWSAHRRFARRKAVPRRALTQLFVPRDVARTAVFDELIPRRRHREARSAQDQALRGARPQAVVHPAFLAVLAALVLTLVQGRALGGSLLGRLGWGVAGGEVSGSTATAAALWRTAADAWGGGGLGGSIAWSPGLGLLAGATMVVEHLPFLDRPAAPVSATVAALLFLTLPAAALSMYAALAPITPSRWIRAFGGLAWAATGLASGTVGQGRIGGAVVLVLLPLAAAAVIRALGTGGRSYDAAQAGLAIAVIGAVAPVVAAAAIVTVLGLGVVPRWSFRRALGAAVAPILILAPFVHALVEEPQLALGGIGLFDWSGASVPAWRLALLDVGAGPTVDAPPLVAEAMPFVAVPLLALAVVGLTRGRHRGRTVIAVIVGAGAFAGSLVLSLLVVDAVPVGTSGAGDPIRPWVGAVLTIYALVVVGLAVRGVDLLARIGLRHRLVRVLSGLAALAAVGVLVAGTGWTGFGSVLSTFTDPRPAVAADQAAPPLSGRSLLIGRLGEDEGAGTATAYRLVSGDAGMPVRALPEPVVVSAPLDAFVARLDVGALDTPGDDLPGGAAAVLARHAIGFVALSDELPPEAVRSLDATDGLRRLPDRDGQRWWRVDSTTSDVPSPARVVLRGDGGDGIAVASRFHAQLATDLDGAGTLEVAEVPAWAELATVRLDGELLEPTVDGASVTYAVPDGGRLVIDLAAPDQELRILAAAAFLVIAFLALPFGGATARREERP